MTPGWLTIFADLAPGEYAEGVVFWEHLTGCRVGPSRGDGGEFATFVPPLGAPHLKVQRKQAGPSSVHLDLHVDDLDEAIEAATTNGAAFVARPGHAVLRSPAGFPFCLVAAVGDGTPAPPTDHGTHRSRADQLTIDVEHERWDEEQAFWPALTGWDLATTPHGFARLHTPPELPVRIMLQRKDEGATGGHLDVASSDRTAEVARLGALGATKIGGGPLWTVLRPPAGPVVCVTDRDPDTGLISR